MEVHRLATVSASGLQTQGHAGWLLIDESQECTSWDEAAAPEADYRELTAGHELVGEGPGDAEQLGCFADGEDESLSWGRFSNGGVDPHVSPVPPGDLAA